MKRIICALIAATFAFSIASAQWGAAVVEPIETGITNDATTSSSIAVDNNETIHVLFKRTVSGGNVDYYYSCKPLGGNWSQEIPVGDTTAALNYAYLAVNKATGLAYVVYLQSGAMKLAVGGTGGFQIFNIVLTGLDALYTPCLTVDDQGRAHSAVVVQLPGGVYKIGYGYLDPATGLYAYQVINNSELGSFGSGASPDIAVLSSGAVVITYRGGGYTNYQIDMAENASFGGMTWNIQTIPVTGYICYSSSLGVTPNNTVHMAFSGDMGWGMPASVFYAYRTAPYSWSQYINVSSNISGVNPKIAVENDGTCHVLFEKRSGNLLTGDIYYTGNVTGNWQMQVLQSGDKYEPSIDVDDFGNCSAVYYHYAGVSNDDVYYYGYAGEVVNPEMAIDIDPGMGMIQIPAGGGTFDFDLYITNLENTVVNFDFWVEAQLPSGGIYGPIILRENLQIGVGQMITRLGIVQNVPGNAPAGNYNYTAKVGNYPNVIYEQDTFPFVKLGVDNSGGGSWDVEGFDDNAAVSAAPENYVMMTAYPNPFNQSIIIGFELRDASPIELAVYDCLGRKIQMLEAGGWMLGKNSVVWDAEGCGSGIYFVRLSVVGGQSSVKKVVLVK